MCGRFTVLTRDEIVQLIEDIQGRRKNPPALHDTTTPRAQARPGSVIEAIVSADNAIQAATMTWGLQPPWSKKLIFNTRIESALGDGRMWQRAIREGRCILPAATFFEANTVHALDDVEDGRWATETGASPGADASRVVGAKPRAYEFEMPDSTPCLLASVYEQDRLSVVTTEPNASVAPVHNRMPLVLRFEEVETWLDGDLSDISELADRHAFELVRTAELNRTAARNRNANPTSSGQLSLFD